MGFFIFFWWWGWGVWGWRWHRSSWKFTHAYIPVWSFQGEWNHVAPFPSNQPTHPPPMPSFLSHCCQAWFDTHMDCTDHLVSDPTILGCWSWRPQLDYDRSDESEIWKCPLSTFAPFCWIWPRPPGGPYWALAVISIGALKHWQQVSPTRKIVRMIGS